MNMMALSAELGGAFSAERLAYAGKMTLLGMLMIFSVLSILWAVLAIFKVIFAGKTEKTPKVKERKEKAVVTGIPDDVLSAVITAGIQAYREDDTATVAVLTAAVTAYREAEGESGEFRVVSFRRASGNRAWNAKK